MIREFSALLQKRCLSLSKGFSLQPKFAAAAAQRFYSSFVVLLEAILQRCNSAVCFVRGDRAFFAAVPTMWNALPDELRALGSLKTFMARLKTHYLKLAFSL